VKARRRKGEQEAADLDEAETAFAGAMRTNGGGAWCQRQSTPEAGAGDRASTAARRGGFAREQLVDVLRIFSSLGSRHSVSPTRRSRSGQTRSVIRRW
jgi:hypothetical protein